MAEDIDKWATLAEQNAAAIEDVKARAGVFGWLALTLDRAGAKARARRAAAQQESAARAALLPSSRAELLAEVVKHLRWIGDEDGLRRVAPDAMAVVEALKDAYWRGLHLGTLAWYTAALDLAPREGWSAEHLAERAIARAKRDVELRPERVMSSIALAGQAVAALAQANVDDWGLRLIRERFVSLLLEADQLDAAEAFTAASSLSLDESELGAARWAAGRIDAYRASCERQIDKALKHRDHFAALALRSIAEKQLALGDRAGFDATRRALERFLAHDTEDFEPWQIAGCHDDAVSLAMLAGDEPSARAHCEIVLQAAERQEQACCESLKDTVRISVESARRALGDWAGIVADHQRHGTAPPAQGLVALGRHDEIDARFRKLRNKEKRARYALEVLGALVPSSER